MGLNDAMPFGLADLQSNKPSSGRCPAFVDTVTAPVGSGRWRAERTGKVRA